MPDYGYFLSRVMQPVSPTAGESGYFSSPGQTLDPHLFDQGVADRFRPEVRHWILDRLYTFWSTKYHDPQGWSTVWIAGSGISYQWGAARGNGDLDVLIGVDYDGFWDANPKFQGISEVDMAQIFNQEFHEELWPDTANTEFSGQTYEVTFYVNPNATDIRNINPYAAYNLTDNSWTVRPPSGDAFTHPQSFYDSAGAEADRANHLVEQYNTLSAQAAAMNPGSPGWHNAMRQADLISAQAGSMYDAIHIGRKQAFGPGGSGYGDYYNFRWQYHKQRGTAQALHAVAAAHSAARDEFNASVYGEAIPAADVVLRRAVLWNRGGNGH